MTVIKKDSFTLRSREYGDEFFAEETDGLFARKSWSIWIYHVATGMKVNFKAFITEFSDSYSQNWESEDVYGRMDPIQRYQNTRRNISLGWNTVAYKELDAYNQMLKVQRLMNMQYPVYEDDDAGNATTITAPPLVKVKLGNLIIQPNGDPAGTAQFSGLLCSLDGVKMTPNLEVGVFDPEPGVLIPQEMSLSMGLTVLHTHKLGWRKYASSNTRNVVSNLRKGGRGFPYNVDNYNVDNGNYSEIGPGEVNDLQKEADQGVQNYLALSEAQRKTVEKKIDKANKGLSKIPESIGGSIEEVGGLAGGDNEI